MSVQCVPKIVYCIFRKELTTFFHFNPLKIPLNVVHKSSRLFDDTTTFRRDVQLKTSDVNFSLFRKKR
jgi:hypothetical protein